MIARLGTGSALAASLLVVVAACGGPGPTGAPLPSAASSSTAPATSQSAPPATASTPAPSPIPAATGSTPAASGASAGAIAALLAHVPTLFRGNCLPEAVPDAGVVVAAACAPAGPADRIDYLQFDSVEAMNAAYAERLAAERPESLAEDCASQASEQPWYDAGNPSEIPDGRLACYSAPAVEGALEFMWTDEALLILSVAVAQTDYSRLYRWWHAAEPGPLR